MYEQAMLRELIREFMDETQQVEQTYAGLAKEGDGALHVQAQQLMREKQRHLALSERLLEIVG